MSMNLEPDWTHDFRMWPYLGAVGLAGTVFALGMGIVSFVAAWFNLDGSFQHPQAAALGFAAFWAAWCLLGIWLMLAYRCYRLRACATEIWQGGVLREQRVHLAEVEELKWRCVPALGSVRLAGSFGVVKIDFGLLAAADRHAFIAFLQQAIPTARQQGWATFEVRFLAPNPAAKVASRRSRCVVAISFIVIGGAFLAAWLWGLGHLNLAAAVLNGLFGGYELVRLARETKVPPAQPS